jgi:hypothetical protein
VGTGSVGDAVGCGTTPPPPLLGEGLGDGLGLGFGAAVGDGDDVPVFVPAAVRAR